MHNTSSFVVVSSVYGRRILHTRTWCTWHVVLGGVHIASRVALTTKSVPCKSICALNTTTSTNSNSVGDIQTQFAFATFNSLPPFSWISYVLLQGGVAVEPNQFPFMASLRGLTFDSHICGGALISERVVITAAHCVDPNSNEDLVQPFPNVVIGGHLLKVGDDPNAEVRQYVKLSKQKIANVFTFRLIKGDDILICFCCTTKRLSDYHWGPLEITSKCLLQFILMLARKFVDSLKL